MTKQLSILSDGEISKLYDLPIFIEDTRKVYFELNDGEVNAMNAYHTESSKSYFILQLGYFKAKQLFFKLDLCPAIGEDVAYIRKRYFPEQLLTPVIAVSKPTRLKQQKSILNLFGYRVADQSIRDELLVKGKHFARLFSRPVYIFRELLNYLELQKVLLPGYSVMQKHIISKALNHESARLEILATQFLSEEEEDRLKQLLEDKVNGFFLLTWLKQEPSSFKYYQMRGQVKRKQQMEDIYLISERVVPRLKISNENIRYYASLAAHYSVNRLKRLRPKTINIYLLCFAYSQYRHINDILIEGFKHYVRTYEKEAEIYSRNAIYAHQLKGISQLMKVPDILGLFTDDDLTDATSFGTVREVAFGLLGKTQFPLISSYIKNSKLDKKELKRLFYQSIQKKISLNIRQLFLNITFDGMSGNLDLIDAIDFVKPILNAGRTLTGTKLERFPCSFIPIQERNYLYEKGSLLVKRYEFCLFQIIRNRIDSGDIYVPDSFTFKSFDQDLIPKEHWRRDKSTILGRIDAPQLRKPIQDLLANLRVVLEAKFLRNLK